MLSLDERSGIHLPCYRIGDTLEIEEFFEIFIEHKNTFSLKSSNFAQNSFLNQREKQGKKQGTEKQGTEKQGTEYM